MSSLCNQIGYFIMGLTNNFSYGIMLSAAEDLLAAGEAKSKNLTSAANNITRTSTTTTTTTAATTSLIANNSSQAYCNDLSTSTILLADIVPSLIIELLYPFLLVGVPFLAKSVATVSIAIVGLIMLAMFSELSLVFTGVALASLSSGLGESTYLSSTSVYGFKSLVGWAAGTGAAGLFSALVYALMTMFMGTTAIMLCMLVAPLSMLASHLFLIDKQADLEPERQSTNTTQAMKNAQDQPILTTTSTDMSFRDKLMYLPQLYVYMAPLFLVYVAEYFINQGLTELIYYPEVTYLDKAAQYRWFQVAYQLGVFVSRSSIMFVTINHIWLMSILQAINAIVFLAHTAKLVHLPSFYLVVSLIFYEGLLGGFTYANCFSKIRNEVEASRRQFATSVVVTCGVLGITVAGFVAIPVHDELCKLYR